MIRTKKELLFLSSLLFLFIIGCEKNDPEPSAKEALQNALVNSTWVINESSSDISGVAGDPDISTVTITFTKSEPGATFTFGGEIASQVLGGAFDINAEGVASNLTLSVDESLVVTSAIVNNASETGVTLSFTTTAASGRVEGIGSYTLSFFNAN